jgi:topoisomerase IA-like protein
MFANLGIPGAEESSQKIENSYGNYGDYLHTGVHARLILNTY